MMAINVMARMICPIARRGYRPLVLVSKKQLMVSKLWHEYQDVVEVIVVDDASAAKMSGGEVDVEPYLNSRNTIGHGTATQILKAKCVKIGNG